MFTGALGTLLHFVYEWSGGSALAAWFSQGREAGKIPVDYTPVKFVKKPAGPGREWWSTPPIKP